MDELQTPAVSAGATVETETQTFPRVASMGPPAVQDGAELAGILLPTETVAFGSRPHPIVLLKPTITIFVALVALTIVATVSLHPIIRGHHVALALMRTQPGLLLMGISALILLSGLVSLAKNLTYLFGYRVVVTNRRVFVIAGVLGRRLRPLGNTPIMASSLLQSFLGRALNYGTVATAWGIMRAMRDPIPLYRSLQVVANGVDGDTWQRANRITMVP